jgi:hypothetical protein
VPLGARLVDEHRRAAEKRDAAAALKKHHARRVNIAVFRIVLIASAHLRGADRFSV